MKASFVILNYNRKNELLLTIAKTKKLLSNLAITFEIIIVDNASADDSISAVKQMHEDVITISRKVNNGIAGWNDGFEIAKGEYLIVLDDDSNIENGLPEAIEYLDNNLNIGILALNVSGGLFETGKEFGWVNKEECAGFIGCGAIIRKKLYLTIGGFAEWLFIYTHEFEYGIRCLNSRYKIKYFENCHVTHRASKINRTSKRLKIYSIRNEMAIIYKFFAKNKGKYLFRIAINNLKVVKRGEWKSAWYTLVGIIKFLQMRRNIQFTPVSLHVQNFFAESFTTTKPAFSFIKRKAESMFKR